MTDNSIDIAARGPIPIWDGAVRLTHWAIALLFAASWYTHDGDLEWHRYAGYALLTLVLFRIYWGFAGSQTARFSQFVRGPRTILDYGRTLFRRGHSAVIGHNPLGAISVLLLLGLLLAQCLIGLFVTDIDGLESGPLSPWVSFEMSRTLSEWHGLLFTALQAVVALHIGAILFYLVAKRDNLITPMLTGRKRIEPAGAPLRFGSPWHAFVAVAVMGLIVWIGTRSG